ncbi:MAG: hypothetical protein ACM32E_30125, partial [Gemmatimonadota bacterium]
MERHLAGGLLAAAGALTALGVTAQGMLRFTVSDDTAGNSLVRAVGVGTGLDYLGAGAGSFFA